MAYGENGPRPGSRRGRARNTLVNNASKADTAVPPPLLSPTQTTAATGQLSALQMTLAQRLAAIQAQQGLIRGQFKMDRAAVKAGKVEGMANTVNDALERGIVGSSIDAAGRVGVEADAAAGLQTALNAKVQGMLGLKTERIDAANEYYGGVFQVQAQQAALQAEAATQAFIEDLVMRMNDESAPGNGRDGRPGPGGPGRDGVAPGSRGATSPQQYPRDNYTAPPGFGGLPANTLEALMARIAQVFGGLPTTPSDNTTLTGRRFGP